MQCSLAQFVCVVVVIKGVQQWLSGVGVSYANIS